MILWYKKNRGLFWAVLAWLGVVGCVVVKYVVPKYI